MIHTTVVRTIVLSELIKNFPAIVFTNGTKNIMNQNNENKF